MDTKTNTDQLVGIAYLSEAVDRPSLSDLEALVEHAARKNAALGVTGMLLYRGDLFVQYLEGRPEEMQAVYECIANDKRHKIVRSFEIEVGERRFSQWGMQLLSSVWIPEMDLRASLHDLFETLDNCDLATSASEVTSMLDSMTVGL